MASFKKYPIDNNNNTTKPNQLLNIAKQSTSPPRTRASLLLSSRRLRLGLLRRIIHRLFDVALSSRRKLVLGRLLAGWSVPVKDHLQRENGVESEAGNE